MPRKNHRTAQRNSPPGRGQDGQPLSAGPGLLQVWTVQQIKWNTTQQKPAVETSMPDKANFHKPGFKEQ